MSNEETSVMQKIVSLCKRRGFIFQSSEIYGGMNGCWDYGPLGVELRKNIKDAWWEDMVRRRDDMVIPKRRCRRRRDEDQPQQDRHVPTMGRTQHVAPQVEERIVAGRPAARTRTSSASRPAYLASSLSTSPSFVGLHF